jgi:hypothetical protein
VEERPGGARRALRSLERILLEDALTAETALAFAFSLLSRLGLDGTVNLSQASKVGLGRSDLSRRKSPLAKLRMIDCAEDGSALR